MRCGNPTHRTTVAAAGSSDGARRSADRHPSWSGGARIGEPRVRPTEYRRSAAWRDPGTVEGRHGQGERADADEAGQGGQGDADPLDQRGRKHQKAAGGGATSGELGWAGDLCSIAATRKVPLRCIRRGCSRRTVPGTSGGRAARPSSVAGLSPRPPVRPLHERPGLQPPPDGCAAPRRSARPATPPPVPGRSPPNAKPRHQTPS